MYEAEKINSTNQDLRKLIVKVKDDMLRVHMGSTKSLKSRYIKNSGDLVSSSVNSTPMISRKNTLNKDSSQEFDEIRNLNNKTATLNIKYKEETNL